MKLLRLPKSCRLPYNYKIAIKLVTPAQLAQLGGAGAFALWRVELMTIYIDKTLGATARIDALLHEIKHATADWDLHIRQQVGLS